MKGLIITLLVLVLLALVKVGVDVTYRGKDLVVRVKLSRFWLTVVGGKEKKPKKARAEKPKKEKPPKEPKPKVKKSRQKSPWVTVALEHWQELLALVGRVLTTPTLDILQIHIRVGGDAEKCAMTYGKVCAAVGAVLPVVENTFRIRKRDIQLLPAFDGPSMEVDARMAITVKIYEIFALVFALLGLGLRLWRQVNTMKKGGANV